MKFLCDVHISYKLVRHIGLLGFKSIHVNEILDKWKTKDSDICKYADKNDFIVVSKDADFRDAHFVNKTPLKLIKINLGNIPNKDIEKIFSENISAFQRLNSKPSFLIEINKESIDYIEL